MVFEFEAELWVWAARRDDGWTFVSLPPEASEEIREITAGPRRGFGAVRVRVRVGATTWRTSVFPDSLAAVVALRKLADRLEDAAVEQAMRTGWGWPRVAEALGVTRQAVYKKHAQRLIAAGVKLRRREG
jgi:hypothetical protein